MQSPLHLSGRRRSADSLLNRFIINSSITDTVWLHCLFARYAPVVRSTISAVKLLSNCTSLLTTLQRQVLCKDAFRLLLIYTIQHNAYASHIEEISVAFDNLGRKPILTVYLVRDAVRHSEICFLTEGLNPGSIQALGFPCI